MDHSKQSKRYLVSGSLYAVAALLLLSACQMHSTDAAGNVTVSYDEGGWIDDRQREIVALRRAGQFVAIRGTCISSCTMYIALMRDGLACVDPDARIGFHGSTGKRAPPDVVDRWDNYMAETYPPNIRAAYWTKWRHTFVTFRTGAELKAMDPSHIVLCD